MFKKSIENVTFIIESNVASRFFQIILHCKCPESERIYSGQKRFTKGFFFFFFEINVAHFACKNETFLVVFKT